VGFMVNQAVGTGFFFEFFCFSVNMIPPMLHTHFCLHVALTSRTKGQSPRTFQAAKHLKKKKKKKEISG